MKCEERNLRIIFRGLILFRFEEPRGNGNQTRGQLTACMINPGTMGANEGLHVHTPRMALIGRAGDREFLGRSFDIEGKQITVRGLTEAGGVIPLESFHEYVPRLSEVYEPQADRKPQRDLVSAKIVVPGGRIWARTLVSWTRKLTQRGAEIPVVVKFFGSEWEGAVASECVLEAKIGEAGVEIVASPEIDGLPRNVTPLTEDEYRHEVDPGTVEIMVTHFAPQRCEAVPWSVHYQSMFAAAGYRPRSFLLKESRQSGMSWEAKQGLEKLLEEKREIVDLLENYDEGAKADDERHFPWAAHGAKGFPFPYIPARNGATFPYRGRRREALSPLADAQDRPLCPPGDDD